MNERCLVRNDAGYRCVLNHGHDLPHMGISGDTWPEAASCQKGEIYPERAINPYERKKVAMVQNPIEPELKTEKQLFDIIDQLRLEVNIWCLLAIVSTVCAMIAAAGLLIVTG